MSIIAIAWLEKQGEQNPADNGKPKFYEGEWVIRSAKNFKHNTYLVKEVKDYYVCEDLKGRRVTFTFNDVHKNFKLWDISDAKDGDVLFQDLMDGMTFIYDGIGSYMEILYSFLINNNGENTLPYNIGKPNTGIGTIEDNRNIVHPATKEQRDLLFQKMKEAGYEWDSENKELKKIEQNIVEIPFGTDSEIQEAMYVIPEGFHAEINGNEIFIKQGKQKPVEWSEEDMLMIESIIQSLEVTKGFGATDIKIDWLKSLKPQSHWKPSDEQIKTLEKTITYFVGGQKTMLESLYNEIKKLI